MRRTKEQLRTEIEELRVQLNSKINGRGDLAACQELSEKLDALIEEYYEM